MSLKWIFMASMSPIAILLGILIALYTLLRFLLKATLLFVIVIVYTPFQMMYTISHLMLWHFLKGCKWNDTQFETDPRTFVNIDFQTLLSDFFRVIASELLVVVSAGIITFYTAPRRVFYISTAISVVAIFHKWLNTKYSISKTALSSLCGGCQLNPLMFFFSFIGLFDLGGHPIAKSSFLSRKAYIFVKDWPDQLNKEDGQNFVPGRNVKGQKFDTKTFLKEGDIEEGQNEEHGLHRFKRDMTTLKNTNIEKNVEFLESDVFRPNRFFKLFPKINFLRENNKVILESSMVLKLFDYVKCEYSVETLELPEDYTKFTEMRDFLVALFEDKGFVTDKIRGRYEHSMTLLQIVEGVEENAGYKFIDYNFENEIFSFGGFVVASYTI